MTDKTIEQRARELLAEAIDRPPQFLDAMGDGFCFTKDEALRAIARALEQPEGREAVAWLHEVVSNDGEPDQALSFSADDFPLSGVAGYRSVSVRPLYTTPPAKVPEGYVLVPVEPNSAMVAAAHAVDTGHGSWPRNAYRAMLAAAQQPKEGCDG